MRLRTIAMVTGAGLSLGCGATPGFEARTCADTGRSDCVQVPVDDPSALVDAINDLEDGHAVVIGAGTFALDAQLTLRADDVIVWGQGIGETVLDFSAQATQSNGLDAISQGIEVAHFTILDAKKDGLRIEGSSDVHIHHIEASWTAEADSTNGAYGIYPVASRRVLLEDCEANHASDAGIYLGQSQYAIVRNNIAHGNVAGIEIENSQYVDVYGNTAEENTAGLLIFDLPGNPIVGRDVRIFDNEVRDNNTPNFAPGGTVQQVPAGTGTFAMASRRVEIFDNVYENNDTMDLSIVSGLVIEDDFSQWAIPREELLGAPADDLILLQTTEFVTNFQSFDIYVHGNTFAGGSGDTPDANNEFGLLFLLLYAGTPIDNILYDAIQESSFAADSADGNSNDNHICVGPNAGATLASMNLEVVGANPIGFTIDDLYRPAAPFPPFNCTGFRTGPSAPVDLPFGE